MVCKQCGNEMRDDARFCPHCGAVNNPDLGSGLPQGAAPYSAPAYTGPEAPVSGGKKKTGLMVGIGVAVVAVIALIAVFASGLLGSPKGQVEKALAKSLAAYEAADQKLELPDTDQWQRDRTSGQHMTLGLNSINSSLVGYDLSALSGLGLYFDAEYNGPARQMYFDLGAVWNEDDLISLQMAADDALLAFGSPQLLGADFYGMNTETLGADLAEMTGDDSAKDISFNLFDLVDTVLEQMDPEAMEQSFKEANKALWEAVQVKKAGAHTLDINGTEVKTTSYQITVPQQAMNDYVDAVAELTPSVYYLNLYREMFQAMGFPEEEIEELLSYSENLELFRDVLHDAVDEIGDLELEVCLSGGYVSAVLYEGVLFGDDLSLDLYLGGGETYVDDWSMDIKTSDVDIELTSTGDHGLKDGIFTDETNLRIRENGSVLARVTSELSYDPKSASDNLQWTLEVNSSGLNLFQLETSGSLITGDDALELDLGEVALKTMGTELCSLSFTYTLDKNPSTASIDPQMLLAMSEDELEQLGLEVQSNALLWASEMQRLFVSRLPAELLWALM